MFKLFSITTHTIKLWALFPAWDKLQGLRQCPGMGRDYHQPQVQQQELWMQLCSWGSWDCCWKDASCAAPVNLYANKWSWALHNYQQRRIFKSYRKDFNCSTCHQDQLCIVSSKSYFVKFFVTTCNNFALRCTFFALIELLLCHH